MSIFRFRETRTLDTNAVKPKSLVRQLVPYSKLDYKALVLLQSLGYHHKLKPCLPKSESPDKAVMAWTLFVAGLFVAQIFAPILTSIPLVDDPFRLDIRWPGPPLRWTEAL